jgi:hypothetical protein
MWMQYYPEAAIGFQIDENIAQALGISEAFTEWQNDKYKDANIIARALQEQFKMPNGFELSAMLFRSERGGEVSGLEGFEYGKTYVYFRDMTGKEKGWKPFLNRLRKKFDVQVEKATWSEFG